MKSNNTNIGFEKEIWDAACILWGHISAAEYRKVIIGLIFLKYVSTVFENKHQELLEEGEDTEDKDFYTAEGIFFVPENARWERIAKNSHTPEIGKIIDEAMLLIEKENNSLKGVLPKNYSSQDLDKRILGEVVDLFTNKIDMKNIDKDKDLLGRTYEYCIQQFAAYEGDNGGEFYTPKSIVKTIVEILKPEEGKRIYDPCCGSGGMFVQSIDFLKKFSYTRNISIYGQESNADTWRMAKINMAIHGINANLGPHQADTFFNDLHKNVKVDYIMANPPFNLKNWGQEKLKDDPRWQYGLPPENNANYAWIQHMIYHLAPNGKIGLVLANGALSTQTGGEDLIRQKIVEDDLVEGIIALPSQLFYSVSIPVTLWFITKNKAQKGKTLFIDARQMGHMVDRKHRDFSEEDIQKLTKTFEDFQADKLENVKGYCFVAGLEDIKNNDYVLTPGRYVGIADDEDEDVVFEDKMGNLTSELGELFVKSDKLQDEIVDVLGKLGLEVR